MRRGVLAFKQGKQERAKLKPGPFRATYRGQADPIALDYRSTIALPLYSRKALVLYHHEHIADRSTIDAGSAYSIGAFGKSTVVDCLHPVACAIQCDPSNLAAALCICQHTVEGQAFTL